jgi:hypothetical protein
VAWVTGFFETSGTRAASRLHRARSTGSRTSRPSSECLTEYGSRQEVSERLSRICKEIDRSPGPQREPCPPGCKVGCGGGRCGLGNRPPQRLRLRPHRARQLPVWYFGQEHHARAWSSVTGVTGVTRRARRSPVAPADQQVDGGHVGDDREGEQLSDRDVLPPGYLQVGRDRPADVVHALGGKPLGEVVGTPATAVP